ncbi:MAG: hypothetical protein HY231_05250 [Acidobacteria bacterium]|nr:hypothetical protein [Acidobacteriota bacterium]
MSKTNFHRLTNACSALLAISVFVLLALAMPKVNVAASEPSTLLQGLTGTVTGSGRITINDQVAQSGARITNGSVIATDADADATVDLGLLGQIVMRPNTTIKVMLSPNSCQVMMERCGSITQMVPQGVASEVQMETPAKVQVISSHGNLWITQEVVGNNSKTVRKALASGKHKNFTLAKTLTVDGNNKGDTSFTLNCCQCCFVDKINP